MRRVAFLVAAGLGALTAGSPARASEGDPPGKPDPALEEIRARLEAQRREIEDLKARLATEEGKAAVGGAVKEYLESEEGRKALGESATDFRVSWKDGLAFATKDGDFTLKVGGRVHYDTVLPDPDDAVEALVGDIDATAGLRRARVEFSGTIFGNVFYANAIEFSGSATTFKNNFIGVKGLPGGLSFQAGFFKEPVGLEELTSSNFITFVERSLAGNAFAPSFDNGMMVSASHLEDRLHWAFGDFADNGSSGPAPVRFQHNFTGRVCGLPVRSKGAERETLVHLGASFQDRSPESEDDRIQVRPSVPFVPRTQDTGLFSVDSERILGLEAAAVHGPFSVQGEWFRGDYDDHPDAPGPSPVYDGWYAMASWFVTGETRPYRGGAFGRVKPKRPFDGKGGTGAVELAVRYGVLDLDDDGLDGGTGHDTTLGVNWHLNPNCRAMVNYVLYTRHGVGDVNSLVFRVQVDF
jgi:phosphate-selective porin OprO/OprP